MEMTWDKALSVGLPIVGGLVGEYAAGQDKERQRRALEQALMEFRGLDLPWLEELTAEQLPRSAMEDVTADAGATSAQREALASMLERGRLGGMTLEDKANFNDVQGRLARGESAGRQRIAEDMQARGQYGGGAQLAMQLANQQGSAQRASEQGLQAAADASRRGYEAMMSAGRLGGQMRDQDVGEKSRRAQAADAMARYNADSRAQAARYNAGLGQQQWDNRFRRAAGVSGQLGGQAAAYGQSADQSRRLWGAVGDAAGKGAGLYGERDPDELAAEDTIAGRKARGY